MIAFSSIVRAISQSGLMGKVAPGFLGRLVQPIEFSSSADIIVTLSGLKHPLTSTVCVLSRIY